MPEFSPSTAVAVEPQAAGQDRRLHPLSWLFVLLQQLKQFALPLLVLLFTGRGDSSEFWPLVGVAVLALYSLLQYHTFRYRITGSAIVLRSGLLQKNLREIPYARIHNVALHQGLLHRLFGVAEVRLESAGGDKPEARMRVLSLAEAQDLEVLVRGQSPERPAAVTPAAAAVEGERLLTMDTAEVIKLGLVANRGMLVVAAALGLLWQADWLLKDLARYIAGQVLGWMRVAQAGTLSWMLGALMLVAAAMLLLRLLSVLLALLQFHGFRLDAIGARLQVQRGLLTRLRGSLLRTRIQAFRLQEGWMHRRFGRRSLRVDSASGSAEEGQDQLRDLVPLASVARMDALVSDLLGQGQWPIRQWQPLHPQAWRREFTLPAVLTLLAGSGLTLKFGPAGLLVWLALPLWWLRARLWARHAGYAEQDGVIAFREGWLDRGWHFAQIDKLQNLQLSQSPFDRRLGMARLHLDTMGAGELEALAIPYLPLDEARALMGRLAAGMRA